MTLSIPRNIIGILSAIFLFILVLLSFIVNLISPYDPLEINYTEALSPPSIKHLFGTDSFGRDIFTRTFIGARTSLTGSSLALLLSMLIGTFLGGIAGLYKDRLIDHAFSFIILVIWSIPFIIAVIALTASFGRGALATFTAMAVVNSVLIGRFVRGEVAAITSNDFIEAARGLGAGNFYILVRHILPNISRQVCIVSFLSFPLFIATEAGVNFLALGVQPPQPNWGTMIREGLHYIGSAWWLSFFPGFLLSFFVILINLVLDMFNEKRVFI